MKKFILCATSVFLILSLCACDRFERKAERTNESVLSLDRARIYGVSEAPFKLGDIIFSTDTDGIYKYKEFESIPDLKVGQDVSGWSDANNGSIISSSTGRNIVVASTLNGRLVSWRTYEYVPGIIYGESNPGQYDDPAMYNAENPDLEEDRAIILASNLFKDSSTSYVDAEFGKIIQGYLTKYGAASGIFEDYYHTGCDFLTQEGRPFYSPIDGELVYAGESDAYNMLIIYNSDRDISLIILHGDDVSPAKEIKENGGTVKKGDLLGYGGGAGNPAGDTHVHLEIAYGRAVRYQYFSKDVSYTRRSTVDPLVLTEMFGLTRYEKDEFKQFYHLGTSAFAAQNNSRVCLIGNTLYFATDKGIYSCRPDGSDVDLLYSGNTKNLNYRGGYLYFCNVADHNAIYKLDVKTKAKYAVAKVDCAEYLLLIDDRFYYVDTPHEGSMFSLDSNGKNPVTIVSRYVTEPYFYKGSFYYTKNAALKAERIYETPLAEIDTSVETVFSRSCHPFAYDNTLYYSKKYDALHAYGIAFSQLDMSEDNAFEVSKYPYSQAVITHKWLIYSNVSDGDSLYVQYKSNSTTGKLCDDILCTGLTVQGGWLYYSSFAEGGTSLNRINLSVLKKQIFSDGEWKTTELSCTDAARDIILSLEQ